MSESIADIREAHEFNLDISNFVLCKTATGYGATGIVFFLWALSFFLFFIFYFFIYCWDCWIYSNRSLYLAANGDPGCACIKRRLSTLSPGERRHSRTDGALLDHSLSIIPLLSLASLFPVLLVPTPETDNLCLRLQQVSPRFHCLFFFFFNSRAFHDAWLSFCSSIFNADFFFFRNF